MTEFKPYPSFICDTCGSGTPIRVEFSDGGAKMATCEACMRKLYDAYRISGGTFSFFEWFAKRLAGPS